MQSVEIVDPFCDGTYMKPVRAIGIVNGGGYAPGLKAVIRAVVRSAIYGRGKRVIGIRNGFDGLIWPAGAKELTEESVSGILPRGGTILGTTNHGNPFAYKSMENGGKSFTTTLPCAWRMPAVSASTP